MIKIVADTNIFISAILFDGKPEIIIKLAAAGKLLLVTSPLILAEIAVVLKNKFNWTNQQVEHTDHFIREISLLVTPSCSINLIKADEADNRILECAVEGQVDYIVTGDRQHLLPLKTYQGITVIDAAGFLDLLAAG